MAASEAQRIALANARANIKAKRGRKLGSKMPATIEREKKALTRTEVFEELTQKTFGLSHKLLEAQTVTALGTYIIATIHVNENGEKKLTRVRDLERIEKILNTGVVGKDYIIVEGHLPDWRAVESLFNRFYGKPTEHVQFSGIVSLAEMAKEASTIEQRASEARVIEHVELTSENDAKSSQ